MTTPLRCVCFAVVAAFSVPIGTGHAAEPVDLDPKAPPLIEPGRRYRLLLHPGKEAKPVTLIFVAGKEVLGEDDGKKWTNIETLIQEGVGELPIETQGGVPNIDIADYDGDGYQDVRIVARWGTGGTWYNYYRFDGKKYIPWDEAMDLEINDIEPEKAFALASGRSGASWKASYYCMKGPHFFLYERDTYDQAQYLRELVPKEVPDASYVLINEKIKGDRIIYRTITAMDPWQNDDVKKLISDQKVDEAIKKDDTQ